VRCSLLQRTFFANLRKWLVNWMRQKRAAERKSSAARQFVKEDLDLAAVSFEN
jgi:hypothetical protein